MGRGFREKILQDPYLACVGWLSIYFSLNAVGPAGLPEMEIEMSENTRGPRPSSRRSMNMGQAVVAACTVQSKIADASRVASNSEHAVRVLLMAHAAMQLVTGPVAEA